jgi:hypothetical protein
MTSDRAHKSDLRDETPRGRDPGEPAVVAGERERVLAENAEEIRKLGKRAVCDVTEIGHRLGEMKKICGHGNWLPWLQREFGWTDRHALNYIRVYELSLKSENFSDLGIPVSALYLLAAPSTPPEAVDEVIERAKSGERQAHAEIKGTIDKIKTAKATAAGVKPQRGSSKKSTKVEGPAPPDQETLIAEEWNKTLWEIAFYVLQRDGRVDPNNDEWRLLVGRAQASFEALATAAGLAPDSLLRAREGRKG